MIVTGRVGAIGQTSYITSEYEELKAMGSDNIIRIVVKDKNISGYIYAYLVSKYGNTFFHKLASGGVQPYISEEMIKDIPVPLFQDNKQQLIH
jgi:restriction endonuclease S subunit